MRNTDKSEVRRQWAQLALNRIYKTKVGREWKQATLKYLRWYVDYCAKSGMPLSGYSKARRMLRYRDILEKDSHE